MTETNLDPAGRGTRIGSGAACIGRRNKGNRPRLVAHGPKPTHTDLLASGNLSGSVFIRGLFGVAAQPALKVRAGLEVEQGSAQRFKWRSIGNDAHAEGAAEFHDIPQARLNDHP